MFYDIRFALRILGRSPGFALVAILTLGLGIGATTAAFTVVNAVLMRPLRFPHADRLMVVLSASKSVREPFTSAPGVYLDWRDRARSFEAMEGASATRLVLESPGPARHVTVASASAGFLRLIGVQPIVGRDFTSSEDRPGHDNVALLDAGFWRREFGERRDIVGADIVLNGKPHRVIGVLPSGVRFADFGHRDVWVPLAANRSQRTGGPVVAVGLLRPGVAPEAAQAEMDAVMQQIRREHREDSGTFVAVKPLQEWVVGDVKLSFLMLLGAVSFVLVICCANIANLLLARAVARRQEMAVRAALGAGRLRLVRQMLVESIVLSVIGGIAGAGLAWAAIRAIPSIQAIEIPRVEEIALDSTALLIALMVSVTTGVLFGVAPALRSVRPSVGARTRFGNGLVAGQLALATVLITGAGLMMNSLLRLLNIDAGFDRGRILTVSTALRFPKYDEKQRYVFHERLAEEVRQLPGVLGVTMADNPPLEATHFPYYASAVAGGVRRESEPEGRHVGARYLATTGIPLLAGRDFEDADVQRRPVPAILNRATAKALFGSEDPIGKTIALQSYKNRPVMEVVGVAGDARQIGLTVEPGPQIYVPAIYGFARHLLVRTDADAPDLSEPIRRMVANLDSSVAAPEIRTMDDRIDEAVAKPRFYFSLLGAFALAGLLLSAIGVYGVTAYTVSRRTREFGIRMAVGASSGDILRLVLGGGARTAVLGGTLGLAGALVSTRVLSSLLYGVRPGDPMTFAAALMLLGCVALLACWLAARRAAAVDPGAALRTE